MSIYRTFAEVSAFEITEEFIQSIKQYPKWVNTFIQDHYAGSSHALLLGHYILRKVDGSVHILARKEFKAKYEYWCSEEVT